MQNDKVWTKNFLLIIIINFLVFMNHIMILSTFPMFLEQVLGLNAAMAGLAAFGFSAVLAGYAFGGIAGALISALGFSSMFLILSLATVVSVLLYVLWGRKHRSSFTYAKRRDS